MTKASSRYVNKELSVSNEKCIDLCFNDSSVLSYSLMIARKHEEHRSIMQKPTKLSCDLTVYLVFTVIGPFESSRGIRLD